MPRLEVHCIDGGSTDFTEDEASLGEVDRIIL